MELIDKSALVRELERRRDLHYKYYVKNGAGSIAECKYDEDKEILSFINTLEVKEVNLDEELDEWQRKHFEGIGYILDGSGGWIGRTSLLDIAEYFFELGLKTKGE